MHAYVFPGQGAQYPGMGKSLYANSQKAHDLFEEANDILGFRITEVMFKGTMEDLQATRVTQPAVFLHSIIDAFCQDIKPDMVTGHSLGEFTALVAARVLSFEDALRLVSARAGAMQKCCESTPGTMAAVISLDAEIIKEVCTTVPGVVIAANFNCDKQTVISGEKEAVNAACKAMVEHGARRAMPLRVGGAFHSPLMEPARAELAEAIERVEFHDAVCPVYQNVDALPHVKASEIKSNLLMQLTSPVLWTKIVRRMVEDGASLFTEVGPGTVLTGLVHKISPDVEVTEKSE